MGCLMNVLWLVFGGIFTAVEYMIASFLLCGLSARMCAVATVQADAFTF